jgi:glyoxylase-like metal-dependent hydrolase (beta-lactamase superfamily II)
MRKYYGRRIEPLGPVEMIRLGVAPNPEVSENAQALYVSHLHLDHVGLLSTTYPSTPIVFPGKDIARATRSLPTPTAKTNNTDTQTKTFDTNTYRGTRTNVKTL